MFNTIQKKKKNGTSHRRWQRAGTHVHVLLAAHKMAAAWGRLGPCGSGPFSHGHGPASGPAGLPCHGPSCLLLPAGSGFALLEHGAAQFPLQGDRQRLWRMLEMPDLPQPGVGAGGWRGAMRGVSRGGKRMTPRWAEALPAAWCRSAKCHAEQGLS